MIWALIPPPWKQGLNHRYLWQKGTRLVHASLFYKRKGKLSLQKFTALARETNSSIVTVWDQRGQVTPPLHLNVFTPFKQKCALCGGMRSQMPAVWSNPRTFKHLPANPPQPPGSFHPPCWEMWLNSLGGQVAARRWSNRRPPWLLSTRSKWSSGEVETQGCSWGLRSIAGAVSLLVATSGGTESSCLGPLCSP